ncbi:hypothetical protein D3C75_1344440 [compost metagenome]
MELISSLFCADRHTLGISCKCAFLFSEKTPAPADIAVDEIDNLLQRGDLIQDTLLVELNLGVELRMLR